MIRNILVVAQHESLIGGANKSLLDVIQHLINHYSLKITVVVPKLGELSDELKKRGIDFLVFSYSPSAYQIRHDIFDGWRICKAAYKESLCKAEARKAAKAIKQMNQTFDLVYINDTNNIFGYYLSLALGIRYVWHFRNFQTDIKRYVLFEKRIKNGTNGIHIAISHAMKSYMVHDRGIKPELIYVVHNGVTNKNIFIKQPWHNNIDKRIDIIHCGMLMEKKRQIDSIMAVGELVKMDYPVYLHLVGSSHIIHGKPYQDELEQIVTSMELNDRVFFEGRLSDVANFRKDMHIELMCSKNEPFGRVTVEGMQAGLVVIGYNGGATPEIIDDGKDGLLYNEDYHDLALKIKRVCDDLEYGDQLSRNALEKVKTHFTMEQNVKGIYRVMEEALRSH